MYGSWPRCKKIQAMAGIRAWLFESRLMLINDYKLIMVSSRSLKVVSKANFKLKVKKSKSQN